MTLTEVVDDVDKRIEEIEKSIRRIETSLTTYFNLGSDNSFARNKAHFALTGEEIPRRPRVEYDG